MPGPDDDNRRGISRRSFLRGSALSTVAAAMTDTLVTAVSGSALAADAGGVPLRNPDSAKIAMDVNGVRRMVHVEPRTTLAAALRDQLALTGTKVACDRGACSACTVWLDGQPVCACMTFAVDVGARSVTTIEGLARGEALHPVQEAFIAHDAMQCGFCTPGMIMSCAALLERVANPTEENVRDAISGHICRCGTYPHVVAATLAAARASRS